MNKIFNLSLTNQQIAPKPASLEVASHEKVNTFCVQLYQVEKSIKLKLSNCMNEKKLVTDQPTNHTQV
jgi:hypothetical protein